MITAINRLITTTFKQIRRSGWLAWASVFVMTLAFFISSVFIFLAYSSNLFLRSVENKPHIYVFFNSGTNEKKIDQLKEKWTLLEEVETVEYTNEQKALEEFKEVQERVNPQIAESIRTNVLPPSLGLRLHKIEDADKIIDLVLEEQETNPAIFAVRFSKETIDTIKTLFYWLRVGGAVIMGLLLLVIFFFTLLTVEFRTFSRSEEIGIMQLVGGSLWFIRSPFILEGAFYGFIGSLISTSLLYTISYFLLVIKRDTGAINFIFNLFGGLDWPSLSIIHFAGFFLFLLLAGALIGSLNSYIAIRRYIN